jgi:hypothetical protein
MFAGLSQELLYRINNNTYTDATCYSFFKACSATKEFQLTFCEPGNLRYRALCELFPSNLYPEQFYDNLSFRTVIYNSDTPYINIFYKDGRHQMCTFEEINDYILSKDTFISKEKAVDIDCLVLGIPEESIPKHFRIILSNTIANSNYEPVLYNDILSSDLAIVMLRDSDIANPNFLLMLDTLKKCNQSNYIFVVYKTIVSNNSSNIRKMVSQYFPPKSAAAQNVFVVEQDKRKEDYISIRKYLEPIKRNSQTQSTIYRNIKIKDILLKIQASCDSALIKKKQILDAVQWRNSQYWNQVNTMEQYSQVLLNLLYRDIPKYISKAKQMLLSECKNSLYFGIAVNDQHTLGVNVHSRLFSPVSSFVNDFISVVESTNHYYDICKYIRMPSLNIDNIFKGIKSFSYISSQSKRSFNSIPSHYMSKIKKQQAEHIVYMLSKNIDDEINNFLARCKAIIDKNIETFRKSSYIIPYEQIQNDMNNLRMQQEFFKSLMG